MDIKRKPELHSNWIDRNAIDIVRRLQDAGFQTYLVGGCVRDLLAGIHPKDFDIATNAIPQQVKRKVPFSFIIGKRFRLVLVKRGDIQYEVATFRRNATAEDAQSEDPETGEGITGDNYFGTAEEDAQRRDFTINALFYDPIKDELLDYCEGMKDIRDRVIRIIGEPNARLIEDPIRIFRAVRLAHKLNFSIEPSLREAIQKNAESVKNSVLPRRREEFLKLLRLPQPSRAFLELADLGILQAIAPELHKVVSDPATSHDFLTYLDRAGEIVGDLGDPAQLFLVPVMAWLRAYKADPEQEYEALNAMMRDELGMFKLEQAAALRYLSLAKLLMGVENFKRKGERRQQNFLKIEGLTMALHLAEKDYIIPASVSAFWRSYFSKNTQAH